MRCYNIILYVLTSFSLVGCSYKAYQPIVFSDLDANRSIVENKKGYIANLSTDEQLWLDNNSHVTTEVGQFYIHTKDRNTYKVIQHNDTTYLSNRHIVFKDVHNFRDMGGIMNKEGKQIVWGHFFRSGHLSKLKANEFDKVNGLGIKTVIDLRTDKELAKKPDRIPAGISYNNVQVYDDSEDMFSKTKKEVLKGKITPIQADSLVMEFYKLYMLENPQFVKGIVDQLFDSDDAVLFHCSAGKDRTGMIGALVLSILEVDREIILSEYMLSNNYRAKEVEKLLKLAKIGKVIYPKIDYQVIENFSWIKPIYIEAMFRGIEGKYGSMDNYITNGLGISKEKRQQYIDKYTY
ncbi:tyrosine-protein phosphatase [Myroides sp. M-43]|uniref:tyrosine-protein phosphatase n=1 Tax=Myroides oncorhynchi TaxID=2893756 RepID=UPI001E4FD915|nr:tyrosine-protein phosphatase [Myroides oncorhynchi]MCC9044462.1 tyrosine-protein phosphatase [Myroides oncorhynchi]